MNETLYKSIFENSGVVLYGRHGWSEYPGFGAASVHVLTLDTLVPVLYRALTRVHVVLATRAVELGRVKFTRTVIHG